MVVSIVPFVPPFLIGLVFLLGPSFIIALLVGDAVGAAVAAAIAIAAFVWPRDNFYLSNVLCALRTIPVIYLVAVLIGMRIAHSGPPSLPLLAAIVKAAPATYDLAGFRLGVSEDQVQQAINAHGMTVRAKTRVVDVAAVKMFGAPGTEAECDRARYAAAEAKARRLQGRASYFTYSSTPRVLGGSCSTRTA